MGMSIFNRAGVLTLATFTTLAWVWCLTTYEGLLARDNVLSLLALVSLGVILIIDSGSRFARTMHVVIFGICMVALVFTFGPATLVLTILVGLVLATLLATFHDVLRAQLSKDGQRPSQEVKHVPGWNNEGLKIFDQPEPVA